jgi:ribose 5-phosphate isomerase B
LWLAHCAFGHGVLDLGTDGRDSVDYPDFAFEVAKAVEGGTAERGILLCGTGIGMCIAANKVNGVRAAPCHDSITAEMSRRHNDANVLCLSADLLGEDLMERMLRIWLETPFEGGRHARRVEKIGRIEKQR